ncbi:DUF7344 domain-containing protein [Natronobacterium texcoconense]|uniref:DUF7344 domain-containing protein n=1 Tax=Natronobacterium texcoconense TaxID=1095778 RepID=A0A1H0ZXN3_NATTX|nr:hypothetical protein [Natronobacterium texcoconense]SDQ32011.1 hypothetical protein SAMN04489842_0472 [Natronobacterium texcoconense]
MSSTLADDSFTTTAFEVLSDSRRRCLLRVLLDRPDEPPDDVTLSSVATEIASREQRRAIVSDDRCSRVEVALVHRHVPMLADAGVVVRESTAEGTTLSPTDHPLLEADWVHALLENPGLDADRLDRTLDALAPDRRRTVCEVLATRRDAVHLEDLAATIVARETDRRLVDVSADDCSSLATDLAHSHLPVLTDVDLLEYDRGDRTVALATDADLWQVDWASESPLEAVVGPLDRSEESRTADDGGVGNGACWTIQGPENVVAYAHEIADSADDELVVTVPDDGMIQQQCLERWRAAVDRGVDVYVGSRSELVHETVRAAVPGAIVCEPQFDWINFPVERLHHGRVVFADRERAMLVSVTEHGAGEGPHATAIAGSGEDNALVSLLREHFGPRLDRLAEEFDSDVPAATDVEATPLPL